MLCLAWLILVFKVYSWSKCLLNSFSLINLHPRSFSSIKFVDHGDAYYCDSQPRMRLTYEYLFVVKD
jgi:hypothetical protein